MSTAVMPESRSVTALAKVEMIRLAKHPVFLIGFAANAFFLATSVGSSDDYYNPPITTAFFIGLFGMIAMFRLTRSMEKLEEAVGSTPTGIQDRVRALCAATALPGVVGVISFIALLAEVDASAPWALGAWSESQRVAIFFGEVVVACIGGPLLGVAAARWLRFPGAVAALVIGVLFVVLLGEGMADAHPQSRPLTLLRLVSPWAQFTSVNSEDDKLASWLGSPALWCGWIAALCVLAVLGALLKGAEGEQRQKLVRAGAVVGLIGVAFLMLATFLGPDQPVLTSPAGSSVLTGPVGG
ncbi:MAG TPA: hypothetical protein VMZ11_04145 [Mycobacteriales bacterium]|nr:hypothetical protein [Mycobacteriales bacterium]